jgi:hypothetical protein
MSTIYVDKVTGTYGDARDLILVEGENNYAQRIENLDFDEWTDGDRIRWAESQGSARPAIKEA